MNIILFGATGTIGRRIYAEAISRGHHVSVFVRPNREIALSPPPEKLFTGDVNNPDQVAAAVREQAAVVSAFGAKGDNNELLAFYESLVTALANAEVRRLLVVGGAGSLEVAPGVTVLETPDFPKEWLPIAKAHAEVLEFLKTTNLDWTYISPPALIQPGKRTGHYRRGENQLLFDENGKSEISSEDYAIALVDELERPRALGQRITVAW